MKVRIQNYQTAKDVSLDIKGFTVIVGKSNAGKTALLRAIEGSMFNDSVTKKVRIGETDTIVSVEYNDIHWTWKKGENFNDYIVSTPSGTQEYSRVGFNPPSEIVDAGFKEWWVDREKMRPQIAAWHDSIFLLNKGGTAITELMTAVTRLDVVNLAIRNSASEQRKAKNIIKVREKDLHKAKQSVKDMDPLDTLNMMYIDGLYASHKHIQGEIYGLDRWSESYTRCTEILETISKIDVVSIPKKFDLDMSRSISRLNAWIEKLGDLDEAIAYHAPLNTVVIPFTITQTYDIRTLSKWIDQLDTFNLSISSLEKLSIISIPQTALDRHKEVVRMEKFMSDFVQLSKDLKETSLNIDIEGSNINQYSNQLMELRSQIDTCEVCGRSGDMNGI